ncbi:MAG: hypothetical protein DIZ80_17180 [endosymbiont of Galathealinum brachiosum]|uniref:VWFA domain-containing protein n=1 Tax=endosymbiont of Galathealinum brachiosum TaxID=2200906 RepID=A0A370D6X9_9GAMM|nr:MAG: hypothetical protein DIZ80_17180 [endosymbiont of Galathealinum brachiosum]
MLKVEFQSLSVLDQIPEYIYKRLITHQYRSTIDGSTSNSLQKRATGIVEIRNNLINGKQVTKESLEKWIESDLVDAFHNKLTDKTLLKHSLDNESYTNDILISVLNWLDDVEDEITSDNSALNESYKSLTQDIYNNEKSGIVNNALYKSMNDINVDFALQRSLGWDLSKGITSEADLKQLVNVHRVIKKSQRLQSIIKLIGRNKSGNYDETDLRGFNQYSDENRKMDNALPDDQAVNSITGVFRGDDISKMLSSELSMLGNSRFKMLWHVRRAERQLLNYHVKGLLSEHIPNIETNSININIPGKTSIKHAGPMILCVDTSASMKGRPAILAKAIALEAMRVSRLEKRDCHLFCFSGPEEVIQLELNLDHGWKSILEFLNVSINGGTDINNVLVKALERRKSSQWKNADILIMSDGRFEVDRKVIDQALNTQLPSRIFGIQLGQWDSSAYNEICHQVFNLSDVD